MWLMKLSSLDMYDFLAFVLTCSNKNVGVLEEFEEGRALHSVLLGPRRIQG